jgi:hypothetical protein
LQPRAIPEIDTYEPGHWLLPDGSNPANVLAVLQAAQPDAKERIEESLRALLPGLARVRVEPVFYEGRPEGAQEQRIARVFNSSWTVPCLCLGLRRCPKVLYGHSVS